MGTLNIAEQASAPATPASGDHVVYPMDDGTMRAKNDAGVENLVGQMVQVTMGNFTVPAGYSWIIPQDMTFTGELTVEGEVTVV